MTMKRLPCLLRLSTGLEWYYSLIEGGGGWARVEGGSKLSLQGTNRRLWGGESPPPPPPTADPPMGEVTGEGGGIFKDSYRYAMQRLYIRQYNYTNKQKANKTRGQSL